MENTNQEKSKVIHAYITTVSVAGEKPFSVIVFESEEKYGTAKRRVIPIDKEEWVGLYFMVDRLQRKAARETLEEMEKKATEGKETAEEKENRKTLKELLDELDKKSPEIG